MNSQILINISYDKMQISCPQCVHVDWDCGSLLRGVCTSGWTNGSRGTTGKLQFHHCRVGRRAVICGLKC